MQIACLTHASFEGPGSIEQWALARGHSFETMAVSEPGAIHPGEFQMLVVMGGPMSISDEDEHPWLSSEKRLIRSAIDSGCSVLGVCLGAQLVADALGARVYPGEEPEIGWYPVTLSHAGQGSGVLGVLPAKFDALHWHGETFDTPRGCVSLASSELTPNQAFEYDEGRVLAVQFHLELDRRSLGALIENAASDLESDGRWVSSAESMLAGAERFARSKQWLFAMLDAMAARRSERLSRAR